MNKKNILKKISVISIFLLINILLFEFILSYFDPEQVLVKSFDEKTLFSFYPNREGKVVSEEYSISVKTNSNGFRQKSPPVSDIVLLGDSFSEGWGVEESEIFVNFLDKKIINLGVHGSSPILYAIQMQVYIDRFKPKKILIQLFDNDLDDNEKLERFMIFDEEQNVVGFQKNLFAKLFGEKIHNLIKESTLYRLSSRIGKFFKKIPSPILYYKPGREPKIQTMTHEDSLKKQGGLKPLGDEITKKYNNQMGFYAYSDSEIWKSRLSKNKIYLNQLIAIAQKNKIELSFLYIPAKEFFAKSGITGKVSKFNLDEFQKANPFFLQIEEICNANKLQCILLTKEFFNENVFDLYFPYDAHLNRKGHLKLAEILNQKF